ncbi:MAG: HEAT repeat domain-containing protein [Deltaproteobacteria bacterium]|nr:HEAT repeat domain-containing protein [Deltaproteobacteria bacterium]
MIDVHSLQFRIVLALAVPMLLAPPLVSTAEAGKAAELKPKDDALHILREGMKSPDFHARGMAYEGIAFDKKNKELKTILKDGEEDPQWVVRAGVARAYMRLRDNSWKRVVAEALGRATLDPREVLPALDTLKDKEAVAFLVDTLADKEFERQDAVADAMVIRGHARLGDFIVAALGSKSPLVKSAGLRALKQLSSILHGRHVTTVANKLGKNAEVIAIVCEIAEGAPKGADVSFLAKLKPGKGDQALADRVVLARAQHGDRAVGKDVLAIAARREGDERIAAVEIYKSILSKDHAGAVKALLEGEPSPRLKLAVYEVLANMGDRSMVKQAEEMASGTDVELRPVGVYYLGRIGGAGRISEMHRYLKDGIPEVRIAAARVIAWIASPISVSPLRNALDDERRPEIRVEFLRALTSIKDKAAYEALVFYSREKDDEIRRRVVRALGESGDKSARTGLQNALRDRSKEVRVEAVRGFILSDPANAVSVFERSLGWLPRGTLIAMTREFGDAFDSYLELALFSKRIEMREEALEALSLLPKKQAALLRKVLASTDEDDLRVRVMKRLFDLEGKGVATDVKALALSSSTRVRIEAIRLLGSLKGDKEATQMLERFLSEADQRVRIAAALTYLGG